MYANVGLEDQLVGAVGYFHLIISALVINVYRFSLYGVYGVAPIKYIFLISFPSNVRLCVVVKHEC